MPFALRTRAGSRNHVLIGCPDLPMGIGTFRDIFGHRLCPDSSAFDILSIFNVIRKRAVSMRPLTTSTVATCSIVAIIMYRRRWLSIQGLVSRDLLFGIRLVTVIRTTATVNHVEMINRTRTGPHKCGYRCRRYTRPAERWQDACRAMHHRRAFASIQF